MHAFLGYGRGLSVTGNHVRVSGQREELFLNGFHEYVVVSSAQVRTADAAGKEGVPAKQQIVKGRIVAHAAGRMPRRVQHLPLGSARGKDIAVGYIRSGNVVLENLEALHPLEDGSAIGQDSLIGRMHIHRNGVNLEQFSLLDKDVARKKCGFEEGKKYIIWCSHPSRSEKRFSLAQEAVAALNDPSVILYPVYDKIHDEIVNYMCAADVLLLTSVSEGSPNVIKEAMACNCPVVSTDVGDVEWVTGGIEGTAVVPFGDVEALRKALSSVIAFSSRTQGRERIKSLGLTVESVARKINAIYDTL